ncbi:MAG: hypothetical protein ACLRPX_09835, partial [Ruthenibacterium sp.]
ACGRLPANKALFRRCAARQSPAAAPRGTAHLPTPGAPPALCGPAGVLRRCPHVETFTFSLFGKKTAKTS